MRECYTCKKNWNFCGCEDSGYKDVEDVPISNNPYYTTHTYDSNLAKNIAKLWNLEIQQPEKVEKKKNFVEQIKGLF